MVVLRRGTVTRVDGTLLYVKVPDLGGEFGPMPALVQWYEDEWQTDTDPGGGGQVTVEKETYYKKGDRVVVGQLGAIKEDLVCLGRVW